MKKRAYYSLALLASLALSCALISPILAAPVAQANPRGAASVQRNVTYCTAGGVDLKMDIYVPAQPSSSTAPALMYVHGGGWTGGSKGSGGADLETLLARGYVVTAIDYRLAPQFKFPAMIEDVKCAVRYMRAHASSLGIDPMRIGVWGGSAGGHLVALLGTSDVSAGFEGEGGWAGQSSRVQAVVDLFGPADLPNMPGARGLQLIFGTGDGLVKGSPITYISPDDPPFLILHGDKDPVVPLSQSQTLYEKLTAAGVPARLVVVQNAGHGFTPTGGQISPSRAELSRMMADFFDQTLRNAPPQAQPNPTQPPPAIQPQQPRTPPNIPEALSGGERHTFPETGKTVAGRFLQYWRANGGLARFGYPISELLGERSQADGKGYIVQYFERALFEYHPENAAPSDVLLALLGSFSYAARYGAGGAPGQQPNNTPGSVLFEPTGKRAGGAFLDYWRANGGLSSFGYPISEEFIERSALDGKEYRVQYFERAVFEWHPEVGQGAVLLSQLGTFRFRAMYGASGSAPTAQASPTPGGAGSGSGEAAGANCAAPPTGMVPLTDMGDGQYKGFAGGLYPGGSNSPPPAYLEVGMQRAAAIRPLDAEGVPSPSGKVVLLSIGMSNTTQEFSTFKRQADTDPQKSPNLVIVDGAQGGQDAPKIKDPAANFWRVIDERLARAGVTGRQVQAVWLKEATAQEKRQFPADAQGLQTDLNAIVGVLHSRYPNLQIVYLSSRTYGGYATTTLNPEPYAYQSGFAVKWLIEERITVGATAVPWLAWGPYLWTDGTRARADGLKWECSDVQADGTHPSASGEKKVADLLLSFFKSDSTARGWFLK